MIFFIVFTFIQTCLKKIVQVSFKFFYKHSTIHYEIFKSKKGTFQVSIQLLYKNCDLAENLFLFYSISMNLFNILQTIKYEIFCC